MKSAGGNSNCTFAEQFEFVFYYMLTNVKDETATLLLSQETNSQAPRLRGIRDGMTDAQGS
jgi:hypothetical protein